MIYFTGIIKCAYGVPGNITYGTMVCVGSTCEHTGTVMSPLPVHRGLLRLKAVSPR